jgi:metal-sulfur cluster biosynthetic enzyme
VNPARVDVAREALRDVYDPELGLDVVSIGLIYDLVDLGEEGLRVDMTLTTPGCPVSDVLPREAEAAVRAALVDVPVHINVVWDPPWTPERLSPEALDHLGYRPARRQSEGRGLSVRRRS